MQRLVLGVIVATLLAAPAVSAPPRSQGAGQNSNVVRDSWLTTKTKSKLFADGRVKGRKIKVETNAGVVTLRGKVESEKERIAAGQIAKSVDGVKAVNNVLQVGPDRQRKLVDKKDADIRDPSRRGSTRTRG
jgi:hyperosmotically inducible periplasmic protein